MVTTRFWQVLRDRQRKEAMADASYWDERARSRSGFARSVWHSEAFSMAWDARQQGLLHDVLRFHLGEVSGRRIADVGCGTGRITRFLAREGAQATGFDFSPATVEAAKAETRDAGLEASFVVADVTSGTLPGEPGSFDASIAVGCLAVACRDLPSLTRALSGMAGITSPSGVVVLLEPIHQSRLLRRVLTASVDRWVSAARDAGLEEVSRRGMGFVPMRLAFSSFDLPSWVVDPGFGLGEALLDHVPQAQLASDYWLLVLRRR